METITRDPQVRAEVLSMYRDVRRDMASRAAAFGRVRDIYGCMIAVSVAGGFTPHGPVVEAFRVVDGIVERWYRRAIPRVVGGGVELAGAQR